MRESFLERKPSRSIWKLAVILLSGCGGQVEEPPAAVSSTNPALAAPVSRDATAVPNAPKLVGTLDAVDCQSIRGWAWDADAPDVPINVELYDGENLLATISADRLRDDLQKSNKGNGKHGFVFETPASMKDGKPHSIRAKFAPTKVELAKSPLVVNCKDEPKK